MPRTSRRAPSRGALRAIGLATVGLGGAAIGLAAHFARQVLTPANGPEERVQLWALEASGSSPTGQRVWIHGPDAALDGEYSFIWGGGAGHARLGAVIDEIDDSGTLRVAREVLSVERGTLRAGITGRVTGWWYTDPEQLGYGSEVVRIPADGGSIWAWLIRPEPGTEQPGRWAIHIHGRGALPEEALRGVAPLARAGIPSLVLAYRNDPGTPAGIGGRYGLGLAEHRDIDDAIAWTMSQGADRITLVGWSMGGTAAVLSATRGPFSAIIDGLVLDSPGLDWPTLLERQAEIARLPRPLGRLGMGLMQRGWVRGAVPGAEGTDLHALTAEALAADLHAPVLLHISPEDTFVPWDGALDFALEQPELVIVHEMRGEHVKLWNTDPRAWEAATECFVRALDDPHLASRD